MKHAPSTFTAIATLAVFLCLGFNTQLWACSECICLEDNTCSDVGCTENLTTNCKRLEFTPSCDATYTFEVWTECTNVTSNCTDCRSCANLFIVSGGSEIQYANCHTHECDIGNCKSTCSVSLTSSRTYALYVCKVPCEEAQDCDDCEEDCVSYACLSYGVTSCAP
jgi:hypothetical protein